MSNAKRNGVMLVPIAVNKALLQAAFQNAEKVKDSALIFLKPFSNQLTWLDLNATRVTDSGLAVLTDCKNITRLYLQNATITDKGASSIAKLSHLEYLNIYGTKVSDIGLKQLEVLKELRTLYIWQTSITEKGIKAIKKKLPNLIVEKGNSIELKDTTKQIKKEIIK